MQRFLNQHIYDLEIADCQDEGIETIDINYTDNSLVIETFLNVMNEQNSMMREREINVLLLLSVETFGYSCNIR